MARICRDCGAQFRKAAQRPDGFTHAFGVERYTSPCCPDCGSDDISSDMEPCENCNEQLRPRGEFLCRSCKATLIQKISAFFDTLTAEEEEQFDAWMDGNSITDRKNWRSAL